jgi:hypothetical protein
MQACSLSLMKLNMLTISSQWTFQLCDAYFNHWTSHDFLASFELTKPFGSCHVYVLGNHSIIRMLSCLLKYHIPKLAYVVVAIIICPDLISLWKIKSCHSQVLEHNLKLFLRYVNYFIDVEHACSFLYRSKYVQIGFTPFRGPAKFRNFVSRVWDYHGFMASSHLT